jgi:hypothetical protein
MNRPFFISQVDRPPENLMSSNGTNEKANADANCELHEKQPQQFKRRTPIKIDFRITLSGHAFYSPLN